MIRVADAFYRGVQGLVVLVIDPQRVTAPVRNDSLAGGDERFPPIYGPLNLDAVIEVLQFEPSKDRTFTVPDPLRT